MNGKQQIIKDNASKYSIFVKKMGALLSFFH